MREQRSYRDPNEKKKKWNTRSFYITLGVSLAAVGIAALTTYASIMSNLGQTEEPVPQSPVGQTVSGVILTSSPESQNSVVSSTVSSQPQQASSSTVASSTVSKPSPSSSSQPKVVQSTVPTVTEPSVFTYPLKKDIAKEYSGDRFLYSPTMQDWRVHTGMDIRGKVGDVVRSMAEGTVEDIYEDAQLGNVIVISHGTIQARYCGLGATALVKKGDKVKAGQEIGSVGTVPFELTEEPHLHLEVRREGKLEDPASILVEAS